MKLLILVLALLQQQPKEEKPVALPGSYSHPTLAFKIYLPAKWGVLPPEKDSKVSCSFATASDDSFTPRMDLRVVRTKDDAANIAQQYKTAFKSPKAYPDAKFPREGTLAGRSGDGAYFVAEFIETKTTTLTNAMYAFYVSGGRSYTLSFSVPKVTADKYLPAIEAAMKSLRIYDEPTLTKEQMAEFLEKYNAAADANSKKDYATAAKCFKRCTELLPAFPECTSGLGVAHMKLKNYADAETALLKAVELDPGDYTFNFNLGVCLLQQSKNDDAIKHLKKATEIDPASESALTNLGAAYLAKDDLKAAVETLQKAVKADDKSSTAHYNLGLAYEKSNDPKKAADEFRATLKIDAKHEQAKEALKRVTK